LSKTKVLDKSLDFGLDIRLIYKLGLTLDLTFVSGSSSFLRNGRITALIRLFN